jgi:hypothetical protein
MKSTSLFLAALLALLLPVISVISATDAAATRGGTHNYAHPQHKYTHHQKTMHHPRGWH